jgi:hypothetical protein
LNKLKRTKLLKRLLVSRKPNRFGGILNFVDGTPAKGLELLFVPV